MSLLEEIKEYYASGEACPPFDEFENVHTEPLETLRWGTMTQWVFKDGDEYVAVKDVEPATEMQDWGDYGSPEIYPVKPVEVTRVKYVKE